MNPITQEGVSRDTYNIEKVKKYTAGEKKLLKKVETLEKMFNIDITENVNNNYPKEYMGILEFDDDNLDDDLTELLSSCGFQREDRTLCQFALNVLVNWELQNELENIINKALNEDDSVSLFSGGTDANRRFTQGKNIKGDADIVIKEGDKEYHIEVVADYGTWWAKNKPIDLRDFKLSSLIKKTNKYEKVFILALSLEKRDFALIEINNDESLYDLNQQYNFMWKRNCQKLPINYKEQFKNISELGREVYEAVKK